MQIQANGISLEVEDHGKANAIPLILIRGLGTQLIHWPKEFIAGFVNAGFRVITFDNRDVGLSQRCPCEGVPGDADAILAMVEAGDDIPFPYSIDDMARDVVGLMDTMNIPRAHCFGISMGGAILQTLAIEHADRLLSATIVMTSCQPLMQGSAGAALLSRILVYPETAVQYQDSHLAGFAAFGSPGYPVSEAYLRTEAARAYGRGAEADGINRQALSIIHAPDRRAGLRNVTLPCLVIHGVDDALIPVELGAEIAAHISDSEYHAIGGMGHVITPLLSPMIVDIVAQFIKRRS
ncbi:MAG: pimeloyl-ACP methyl ester carboxylesterase [Paracoccaceae bacterium]|jgi:pimeloyl-ACP methyl ester carboxylesterase